MKRARDLPDAVQWHEGMLLAPQHFQQLARRQEDALAYHVLAGLPYCWGVRKLDIAVGLLGAGTLRVNELEAIMPDGLIVSHSSDDPGAGLLELSLEPYAERLAQGGMMAYLAVEKTADRYRSVPGELVTDEHSTAEPIDIPRLRPNLHILGGDEPSARYVNIPLVKVVRENEVYKLGNFVPPRIEVPAESMLKRMCTELAVRLREKTVFLAKQATIPSSGIEDRLQFLELRDRLHSMVSHLPYFEAVLGTESIHPYPLYLALASLCGPLSLLRAGAVPPPPVPYQHTDLHATFATLVEHVNDMLEAVSQSYRELKFNYDDGVFSHPIEPAWLGERLVIGVRAQSERDLLAWMEGALIGSDTVLGPLREKRVLGAQRARIERAEELGLDAGAGVVLFAIRVDPSFILPDRPLMIFNPGDGATSQRPSEIILYVR